MKRFCSQFGQLLIGTMLALCALPSYAQEVTMNMLVQADTITGFGEVKVSCSGEISLDLAEGGSIVFDTASDQCTNPVDETIVFDTLPAVDLPLIVRYEDTADTANSLSFPAVITAGVDPVGDGATFNVVLGGVPSDPDPTITPVVNPTITPVVNPNGVDIGPLVAENACEWARDNDPGTGLYVPGDGCSAGLGLVIYDGSVGTDTEVPGCIESPFALPNSCRGLTSVIGHTIYAQRLKWVDVGTAKELIGQIQATTINTMIGDSVSAFKNIIISVSEIPGQFNTTLNCKDVTASENSDVWVVQSDSKIAKERPGKYCEVTPGKTYYINARFDRGQSANCGKNATCQYTLVERLPEGV